MDCTFPKGFGTIIASESKNRDVYDCRTIYLAPQGEARGYTDGMSVYESQEAMQRPVPVYIAKYKFQIDGREDIIHFFYDKEDTRKIPEAMIVAVYMPDDDNFNDMKYAGCTDEKLWM